MENFTNKLLEYSDSIQNKEYQVKALVVSISEELEIKNIDKEENDGFIFNVSVSTEPKLPTEFLDTAKKLIFIIGIGGDSLLGYLNDNIFIELEENEFLQTLHVRVLEILTIEGNTGHFKS